MGSVREAVGSYTSLATSNLNKGRYVMSGYPAVIEYEVREEHISMDRQRRNWAKGCPHALAVQEALTLRDVAVSPHQIVITVDKDNFLLYRMSDEAQASLTNWDFNKVPPLGKFSATYEGKTNRVEWKRQMEEYRIMYIAGLKEYRWSGGPLPPFICKPLTN